MCRQLIVCTGQYNKFHYVHPRDTWQPSFLHVNVYKNDYCIVHGKVENQTVPAPRIVIIVDYRTNNITFYDRKFYPALKVEGTHNPPNFGKNIQIRVHNRLKSPVYLSQNKIVTPLQPGQSIITCTDDLQIRTIYGPQFYFLSNDPFGYWDEHGRNLSYY